MFLVKSFAKKSSLSLSISKLNLLTVRENQWKAIILEKVIPFTRNHFFRWKLFLLVEALLFDGSHFVYWKIFFYWKSLLLREAVVLSGSRSF